MSEEIFFPFTCGPSPERNGMVIMFLGRESGEVCWTDMCGDAVTDTYGSNVNPDEVLIPLRLIREAIPPLFQNQVSTWGEDGLIRGEVWVLCKMGDEMGAIRCDGTEIKHTILPSAIRDTLEEKLAQGTQQIKTVLGIKERKGWKSTIAQAFGL